MEQETKMQGYLFYSAIFMALGTGIVLKEELEEILISGYWFLGFGLLLSLIGIFIVNTWSSK